MRDRTHTRRTMNGEPDVALPAGRSFTGVNPDPDENRDVVRPLLLGQGALDRDRSGYGTRCTAECDEERVAQKRLVPFKQFAVGPASELLEQSGGPLDARKEEGDRAAQTLTHAALATTFAYTMPTVNGLEETDVNGSTRGE